MCGTTKTAKLSSGKKKDLFGMVGSSNRGKKKVIKEKKAEKGERKTLEPQQDNLPIMLHHGYKSTKVNVWRS